MNKRERKPKGQSEMDNAETLTTRRANQKWTMQRH